MSVTVFDGYSRVVDQNADRESQPAKGHGVHRFAHRAKYDDRTENRERNGDRDYQRTAPTAQKEKDHERRETRCNHSFAENSYDRCLDENGLIEEFLNLQSLRSRSS